jgi:hypothetical protein
LSVVNDLDDQVLLAEIAKQAEVGEVRRIALERLTDQNLLFAHANTTPSAKERLLVAGRLSDQALAEAIYLEIATCKDNGEWLRDAAAKELRDEEAARSILAELDADRRASEEFLANSEYCAHCRLRFSRSSCRTSERDVHDREDSAFDLVETTDSCPCCGIALGSSWAR